MAIGGDPSAIRELARRARGWEAELREVRTALQGAEGIEWVSSAADEYRGRLEQRCAEAGGAADRMADLGDDLDHLAATLESRQAALAHAFEAARDAWDEAVEAGEELVEDAWEYAGDLAGFARDQLGWLR